MRWKAYYLVFSFAFAVFLLWSISVKSQETLNSTVNNQDNALKIYDESYALVIGINDYAHWSDLNNAVADANEIERALLSQGFDVTKEINPNVKQLKEVFENFFYRNYSLSARLFVWFSGHGYSVEDEGFLIAKDTPSYKHNKAEFFRNAMPIRRFREFAQYSQPKHIFAVFDACFAGTIFALMRGDPLPIHPPVRTAIKHKVRQFLTSGGKGQRVSDNGKFRKIFINAIGGGNKSADLNSDGYLLGSEISQYMQDQIKDDTQRKQIPQYGKIANFNRGDFVFNLQNDPIKVFNTTQDCDSFCPQIIEIPFEKFRMGDIQEYPDEHSVVDIIPEKRIAAGIYEVTFEEYDYFCQQTGCEKPDDNDWGRGKRPVINVSLSDAYAYIQWLSEKTGAVYRLPTEMEWEYIARAGTNKKYWWGNEIESNKAACDQCNSPFGWDAENKMTAEGGFFKASPYGLYDTVGNVWEWTCSEYSPSPDYGRFGEKETRCVKKASIGTSTRLVIKGGSWEEPPKHVRAAYRLARKSNTRTSALGFRVVKELK